MLRELRDFDHRDVGGSPLSVRIFLLAMVFILIIVAAIYFQFREKKAQFDREVAQESALRTSFEDKQQKAANLEQYEAQLAEMEELLESMLRQLPSATEMDKLLVDISQTALGAGIENQLFRPGAEAIQDFYAERPITIRMVGDYHQFGEFVSGVASLPRVVILTMHDIQLTRQRGRARGPVTDEPLVLEGTVKTYRYVEDDEAVATGGAQ